MARNAINTKINSSPSVIPSLETKLGTDVILSDSIEYQKSLNTSATLPVAVGQLTDASYSSNLVVDSLIPTFSVNISSVEAIGDGSIINTIIAAIEERINDFISAQFYESLTAGSTGVDALHSRAIDANEFLWGRNGADWLLGYDPSDDFNGLRFVDAMIGDGQPADRNGFDATDTFVLGEWRKPYYASGESEEDIFGITQFAQIRDFQPDLDILQLYGTPEDYSLISTTYETEEGVIPVTLVMLREEDSTSNLIAILENVEGLSLYGSYFRYEGYTPPAISVAEVAHLGSSGTDISSAPTHDAEGNLYVVGYSSGALGTRNRNAASFDVTVTKYDPSGNQLWIKQIGTDNVDFGTNITTDQNGNFYIVGATRGDFGGRGAAQGREDGFLAKYDSNGNLVWKEQFGTTALDLTWSIKVDEIGDVYIAGGYSVFDEDDLTIDDLDAMVAKYDSNGNNLWFQTFGNDEGQIDESYGVVLGKTDYAYAFGLTWEDLGGPSNGLYDIWVAKLDKATGERVDITQFGSTDYEYSWSLDIDSQDNIYGVGWTSGNIAGEGSLDGRYDAWIVKYDQDLNQQWIKQIGSEGSDSAYGVYVDQEDNIYVSGYTDGDLGGENAGSFDAWVGKFDSQGNQLWITQFGTAGFDQAGKVSVNNGSVIVVGGTDGSMGADNVGSLDAWVARLDASTGTLVNFTSTPEETAAIPSVGLFGESV